LFEKPSTLGLVSPRGALGAYTEELDERFRGVDASIRGPLLKDMQAENETLELYVEKCRLEKWFEEVLDLAKRDIQEEMNQETEAGGMMKKMAQQLQQMEQRIASDSQKAALDMLRSKPRYKPKPKLNGSASGFKSSHVR
jgi:nuclear pore complex protein Nup133